MDGLQETLPLKVLSVISHDSKEKIVHAHRVETRRAFMAYMGIYQHLLSFADGVADGNKDQVYYFTNGLTPSIGGTVVTTLPLTLQDANNCSLAWEAYIWMDPEEGYVMSSKARADQGEEKEESPTGLMI
ncbi:hypothetical protein Scep_014528 [Stephania cephalantha]|uniref:Uncharacterized protein n=1 Tax=Stephania cephalantha TaxID=152367 RepID=A0AAP0J157_9MAGN